MSPFVLDQSLTQWINSFAGQTFLLDQFLIAVANFGVPIMVLLIVLRWWKIGDMPPIRHSCLVAGLSFLLAFGINLVVAAFVHRVRPNDAGFTHLIIPANPDWSFPSDHAAAVSSIVSALWLTRQGRFAACLGLVAGVVCLSRVFVGVHYLSDVLGGLVIGTLAAYLVSKTFTENKKLSQRLVRIL